MHPLSEFIASAAAKSPDAPALLAPGRAEFHYDALWRQMQAHLRQLRALGIEADSRVAIVLPNGPDMAAAFLSVACTCAAAPLNPNYTREDFRFYLSDLSAKAVVVSPGSPAAAVEAADELGVTRLTMTPGAGAGEFRLVSDCVAGDVDWPGAGTPALLLHTSGTTSRPKLVPLSAANLASSARNIAQTLALGPEDRCLNIMPLFHIHGLAAALLATMAAGGSVVCTNGLYSKHFFEWLEEFQPSWYTAVPTMHQAILARARELGDAARRAKLRFVRSSSASLPPVVLEGIEEAFGAPMLEAYGMTEASHQMASNPLPPQLRKPGSVGLAAGPDVAIMNDAGDLLPEGEVGEVVIRGENVTAGYLSNPAANDSAFTNGWFRTGDQGRFDADGYLFLTGRLKELINRGGEKISPREIDEALLSHPQVKQALAFAIPHAQLGEEVGAAVELRGAQGASEEELRKYAAGRLPRFKVPRVIRIVEAIPKGPTGKLQRIGLAQKLGIEAMDDRRLGEYEEPRAGLEQRIAAVWRRLLPEARCGRYDRFEALGGDSLLAVSMLAALSEAEGVEVPFEAFVTQGTIAALAEAMADAPAESKLFQVLKQGGGEGALFCFPGHDGALLGLSRMAQSLKADLRVYGLDLLQCDPQASLEEHAEMCLPEVLRLDARGPYRLAGVCLGGCLAYAVAERLIAIGRHVDLLVLIDALNPAWAPGQGFWGRADARRRQWMHKLRHHSGRLDELGWMGKTAYLTTRLRALFHNNAETAAARLALPVGTASYRRAMIAYRPKTSSLGGLVIRLQGRRLEAPELGWGPVLQGGLQLVDLPLEPEGALARESAVRVAGVLNDAMG